MPKQFMVFGYVRVSTENQLENYSIDEQINRIKAYCSAKGWLLLKIYTDGGFSGGNINRPALKQMLADIKTNKVDAVLVYKLDRLSRSQKDTLTLIEDKFLANDVDFVSINENFDTSTPFGRAMIGILSVFAQLEKDQITERFTMGRIGRSKSGYFHGGGNAPFGYTYENGELIVNETQALLVNEIYTMFLSGKSINAISNEMSAINHIKWSATKTKNILTNAIYIGKIKFAKTEYQGKHTPIVSKQSYDTVQKLLFSNGHKLNKSSAQKTPFRAGYLLSSLIVCCQCGARYSANHGYYKCYSRSKSSKKFIANPDCKNYNWKIEELDDVVVSEIYNIVKDTSVIDALAENRSEDTPEINIKKLTARLKTIDNQISNLVDLYQLGSIPMDLLSQKIKALDVEKDLIQKKISSSHSKEDIAAAFLFSIKKFEELFDDATLDTKRLLISTLITFVKIDNDNVSIEWRI